MQKKNMQVYIVLCVAISLLCLSGCKKQGANGQATKTKKAFRDLNYEDLKVSSARLLSQGKKDLAIKHIEKMIPLCNNIQELRNLTLQIADLYFDLGNLKKAEQLYSQFGQHYPGDKNIEYATYRAILCNEWLSPEKQRDQSNTKKTVELAKEFLARSDIFKKYIKEVQQILVRSQNKLLESEICIFEGYLNRGDQLSAQTRLVNIQKEFLPEMPHVEPRLLALACQFAQVFDDKDLLLAKQEELNTKFPNWPVFATASSGRGPNTTTEAIAVATADEENKEQTSFLDKF